MKFLKTIRFDPSDDRVFENAAGPDEWAIPGSFHFAGETESTLSGKRRQAFSNGFLSLANWGHSTFTSVATLADADKDQITEILAVHLCDHYGAPDLSAAQAASIAEIEYVIDLCSDVPINSIFALSRHIDEEGEIREEFRIIDAPGEKPHARVWDIVEE